MPPFFFGFLFPSYLFIHSKFLSFPPISFAKHRQVFARFALNPQVVTGL
ncbi:hypothetical protein FIU95_15735 [Microbulbifer sp. THAF38]|nr:hypothetical protein FIU95_15735 [Microbulbifer sp. THAF38]